MRVQVVGGISTWCRREVPTRAPLACVARFSSVRMASGHQQNGSLVPNHPAPIQQWTQMLDHITREYFDGQRTRVGFMDKRVVGVDR